MAAVQGCGAGRPRRAAGAPRLEPRQEADRRSVLQGASGTALCLAPSIAIAAEDPEAVFNFFPEAKMSAMVDDCVGKALEARGFNTTNTLFAHSVCSDEVNYSPKEIIELMRARWGESFTLGGLAGVPFAGKAGLNAYAHHVPDEGKLFVMFAPHVGVGMDGKVGALERAGIKKVSSACGAAVGAYKVFK